jgi:signal transduction histidine kinase
VTREEAHVGLASVDTGERLRAARFFAMNAIGADRRRLRSALRRETVPWIRRALERSLSKVGPLEAGPEPSAGELGLRQVAALRAEAIDEVATTIVHELATIIARLRLKTPVEVHGYEASVTKTLVDSLDTLLKGIRALKTSSGRAEYAEMELGAECRATCEALGVLGEPVRLVETAPLVVELDSGLFRLALSNVVRNAVEAVASNSDVQERAVAVNWGRAGHEVWVTVVDNGPGFERDPAALVRLGESTKQNDHFGFGLATARSAMQMMEGDIYPTNAAGGGARVELRWFGTHEDTGS